MERRLLGLEEDRRAFQKALDSGGKRLTVAALILGSLLALGQIIAALVAMTPDSYAAKWFQRLWSPPAQMGPKK